MKKYFYLMSLMVGLLVCSSGFMACGDDDDDNGNGGTTPGGGGSGTTTATVDAEKLIGLWYGIDEDSDSKVNVFSINFMAKGVGVYSEFKAKAKNNWEPEAEAAQMTWELDNNTVKFLVTIPDKGTQERKADILKLTDNEVAIKRYLEEGTDEMTLKRAQNEQEIAMVFEQLRESKIEANADRGDLGISTPDLWERTATSLTVHAHVTGSVSDYLWQFPNYSCGLIWCPASEGKPTMNSKIYTAGGDDIYYDIEGLTPETEYNVAAWLKFTPDSEPVISEVCTFTTDKAPQPNGSNWVRLLDAEAASSTTLTVTFTAYYDDEPTGIGVVYNTTGAPTLDDKVYNGFDHVNKETGETDDTILSFQDMGNGVRHVSALINNVQPGTTYHIRGYMSFSHGILPIYSTQELTVTTPKE